MGAKLQESFISRGVGFLLDFYSLEADEGLTNEKDLEDTIQNFQ